MASKKPTAGQLIQITARKVSDKVQPHIKQDARYFVAGTETDKQGKTVLLVHQPGQQVKTWRVSQSRFEWCEVNDNELREERFIKDCARSARQLTELFDEREHIRITILPLVIYHVAWTYAMKAVEEAARNRVALLKPLTRTVRELQREYRYQVTRDLDSLAFCDIERQADAFLGEIRNDMTIFYFTVNREFKLKMPDYPYEELRTFAIMAYIIIGIAEEHIDEMDKLINDRMGQQKPTILNPFVAKLKFCMEAMAGDVGKFDYGEFNVQLCKGIFKKNLNKIEFNIA